MPREHTACPCCGHTGQPIRDEPSFVPIHVARGGAHHRVLKALRKHPRLAEEVARKVRLSPNETASRLLELRRAGLVEYQLDPVTGEVAERMTSRKTPAKVQRITLRGRALLASL